jgi:peptide/nickel transport system substrate-binding protein
VARALAAALAVSLALVSGAGGAGAQTPKRGGAVVIPAGLEPACLNLFGSCNLGSFANPILGEVLEGAFEVGPDLSYRPNLVSRAEIVSKLPFVVVFRIRPEARWSDGVPVTASDFVFTHRTFRDHATTAPGVDWRVEYRKIRRVVRVDAKTARVVFRERFADWRTLFALVLPRHVLAGQDITAVWRTSIDDPRTGRPIGSGPFLVGGWERGREITLVRNPRYWGPHTAYLDRLVARFPSGLSDPVEALRGGHRDLLALIGADPDRVAALRAVPGVAVRSAPMPALEYLLFRLGPGGHAALRNKLVRQALAFALDRSAIARIRTGDALLKSDSAVLAKVSRFYQPTWSRYRFDPVRARRLLEQAGCRRGADGIYACGGERLSLQFVTTAGNPVRLRTLELMQAQLRQSGIEARPEYAPNIQVLIGSILRSGEFDLALVNVSSSTERIPGPYCGGQDENWTGYCNRLTNRDLLDADASVDERHRARVLNAADAKLARDVPVIPLAAVSLTIAHRSNIRNVVPNPAEFVWNSEDWWLER